MWCKLKRLLYAVLIFVLVGVLASSVYQKIFYSDNPVNLFGYSVANIVSGSMEPTIKVGSVVLIKYQNDYNVNDVITYKDESGMYITHRIISIENGSKFITKGDANNASDAPFSKEDVVGRVVLVIPLLGSILGYLSSPSIFITSVVLYVGIAIVNKLIVGREQYEDEKHG